MSGASGSDPVVVVGGGVVGLCTAFALRKLGRDVVVIERGEIAGGASAGNAGSISPGALPPVAYPGIWRDVPRMLLDRSGPLRVSPRGAVESAGWLLRFFRESSPARVRRSAEGIAPLLATVLDDHRRLAQEIGAADLFQATGQLQLYPDRAAFAKDAFGWALRKEFGVEFYELRREEILQYEPEIGPGYGFGLYVPRSGMIVDPHGYGEQLAHHLSARGVRFAQDEVSGLDFDGRRVAAVEGRAARYPASAVVLCAGAWSARIVERYGYRIPLINQRGYHLEFAQPGVQPRRVVALADRKVFLTPMRTGLRAAGTVEISPLDSPPDMSRAQQLREAALAAFPRLSADRPREWSGERPCLPDSLPVMGAAREHANLWFNFGHGHLGLTLSATAGHRVAEAIAAGQDTEALAPYAHSRFG